MLGKPCYRRGWAGTGWICKEALSWTWMHRLTANSTLMHSWLELAAVWIWRVGSVVVGFGVFFYQRAAKGASGKGSRQKTAKVVKKCQKYFRHFRAGQTKRQKVSKIFSSFFDNFRAAPVFRPLFRASDFGVPRLSVQRPQNPKKNKHLRTSGLKIGTPQNGKSNHDRSNPPILGPLIPWILNCSLPITECCAAPNHRLSLFRLLPCQALLPQTCMLD